MLWFHFETKEGCSAVLSALHRRSPVYQQLLASEKLEEIGEIIYLASYHAQIMISTIVCMLIATEFSTAQVFRFRNFGVENNLPSKVIYTLNQSLTDICGSVPLRAWPASMVLLF